MTTATKNAKFKRLSLQELFKQQAPIWVRNLTGGKSSKFHRPGMVTIQVGHGDMIERVTVPPGADPVCLSDMVNYESLKTCSDLFKCIRSGLLELLDPGNAEKYYQINEKRRDIMQKKLDDLMAEKRLDQPNVKEIQTANIQIDPAVADVCLKLKHDVLSEKNALELLLEKSAALSVDDYGYLLSNGKYDSIKQWAREQMNHLTMGEDTGDVSDTDDLDKEIERAEAKGD